MAQKINEITLSNLVNGFRPLTFPQIDVNIINPLRLSDMRCNPQSDPELVSGSDCGKNPLSYSLSRIDNRNRFIHHRPNVEIAQSSVGDIASRICWWWCEQTSIVIQQS